jgi:hypothetical protein
MMALDVAVSGVEDPFLEDAITPRSKPNHYSTEKMHLKQDQSVESGERKKPLQLLDLPEDVLQTILREVTHTNDLTALALTHSTLHDLVIPHIYSRFDIVWPEANTHIESRVGVDALTYGLATLVMASDVFGEAGYQQGTPRPNQAFRSPKKIRRGNHFAQYTKKFSLGNGPADWVSEYLITKEGGKMLGTLVALAVGRMRNLEAFIWDMPTGVLRDVWLALASLGNRDDGRECRLDKVWVRWHENPGEGSPLASPPAGQGNGPTVPSIPAILHGTASAIFQIPPYPRVEFPTFSILPPLRSLTVLDIDEQSYVEEMSVLVENSLHKLRELRIGMADHAQYDAWAMPTDERSLLPPPLASSESRSQQQGGVLGILVHRFCIPTHSSRSSSLDPIKDAVPSKSGIEATATPLSGNPKAEFAEQDGQEITQVSRLISESSLEDSSPLDTPSLHVSKRRKEPVVENPENARHDQSTTENGGYLKRMQLNTIELERIYLSVLPLARGIDWSRLESITLLGCRNHEFLWKELRQQYAPPTRARTPSTASRTMSTSLGGMFTPRNLTPLAKDPIPSEEYRLKIKKIHTDTVSTALIQFIRDALAPNSLDSLFLQENSTYKSSVGIDVIYRGAIRRHRGSLRKLLIDSECRKDDEPGPASWRRWVFNRELLGCITSGKMRLRELSMSIDYKDWHYFLQRLPSLNGLRSLHIAHIADHVHGSFDSREAALQVLDIVSLRPDLELCYLGVQRSCFEVLEYDDGQRGPSQHPLTVVNGDHDTDSEDNDDTIEEEIDDGHDFDVETSHGEETEDESPGTAKKMAFKLREILFYDDKVSIFRARHGRL